MSIGLTAEHREIASAVRSFVEGMGGTGSNRRALDDPNEDTAKLWCQFAELGWLNVHLPEDHDGGGFGLPELAVIGEELGRSLVPVPFIATVVASAAVVQYGSSQAQAEWIPRLTDGSVSAGIAMDAGTLVCAGNRYSGTAHAICEGEVSILVLPVGNDLVLIRPDAEGVTLGESGALDPVLGARLIKCERVESELVLPGASASAMRAARVIAAAQAAGGARRSVEIAVDYAKVREQFGRPIGMFQAVKHLCADMLADAELSTAAVWDAARAPEGDQAHLAELTMRSTVFDAFARNSERSVQIHGGIGFTWEHDCHLFVRRAYALRGVYGDVEVARRQLVAATRDGLHRTSDVEIPDGAQKYRPAARDFVQKYLDTPEPRRRELLVDSGYMVPHWPSPFGRDAAPAEQLVIEQEFGPVEVPNLGIGAWILATLVQHGTSEQLSRWIRPSLLGEHVWCQLFSEPGAGSDAAAVSSRGVRVEGGWRITGQKVWTSNAQNCTRGLITVRTNREAPKHKGITTMVVDLSADGVTIRPLREITGNALFNEVFFDDVFVPDADVVGEIDRGWTVARATLGNERVSIGGFTRNDRSALSLPELIDLHTPGDSACETSVGELIAHEQAMRMIHLRGVSRAVIGTTSSSEGAVAKLLAAEHVQAVTELAMRLCGASAVVGSEPEVVHDYLLGRSMTIAGGTSEIVRNVIAERSLGLPRDPSVR